MVKSVRYAEREVEERLDANTNEIFMKAIASTASETSDLRTPLSRRPRSRPTPPSADGER
jgi:hypothetical protein